MTDIDSQKSCMKRIVYIMVLTCSYITENLGDQCDRVQV